jgi:hypothetical protein
MRIVLCGLGLEQGLFDAFLSQPTASIQIPRTTFHPLADFSDRAQHPGPGRMLKV